MILRLTKNLRKPKISNISSFLFKKPTKQLKYFFAEFKNPDPYKILGIQKNATEEDIKRAFRVLAKKYHPDKDITNEKKFRNILHAYHFLSDKQRKREFDDEQSQNKRSAPGLGGMGINRPTNDPMYKWLSNVYSKNPGVNDGSNMPPHLQKNTPGAGNVSSSPKAKRNYFQEGDTVGKAEKYLLM